MAPPSSSVQFIDTALSCATAPFALSYSDPNQKWLIRKHLLALLRHHPSLSPSSHTFFHNDGTAVNLLTASGNLPISAAAPPVPITIWVHHNYPFTAPLVFVTPPSDSPVAIHRNHPFVDFSSAVACPYVQTWKHQTSNLSDLVQNLVNIFSVDHPFYFPAGVTLTRRPLASKMEALDRLAGAIHYDVVVVRAVCGDEIDGLAKLQGLMAHQAEMGSKLVRGLEEEREGLRRRVAELTEHADVLANWIRVNGNVAAAVEAEEEAFEAADEEAKVLVESLAADRGIEDLIYAMDKAVEEGVVGFDLYMKQVRVLAREQFFHRDRLVKLIGPEIIHWPY